VVEAAGWQREDRVGTNRGTDTSPFSTVKVDCIRAVTERQVRENEVHVRKGRRLRRGGCPAAEVNGEPF
jgi:hypothetical protein